MERRNHIVSGQYAVLFVIGFFVYIALMILIAYLTSKKGTTQSEDYLMGGRNIGLLLGCSQEMLTTVCVLTTGWSYMLTLQKVYSPMTKYRKFIIYSMQIIYLLCMIIAYSSSNSCTARRTEPLPHPPQISERASSSAITIASL